VLLVVGSVAIGIVALGGGLIGLAAVQNSAERREAEQRIDEYLDNEAEGEKEFFAADSQFRAAFPTIPQRQVTQTEVAGIALEFTMYSSPLGRGGLAVGTFGLPPEAPFDLNLAVNGSAAAVEGRVESAAPTTWQGFDAVEAVIAAPDGAVAQMLVVRTPQRVYTLEVVSFDGPSDAYEAFKSSFEIIV
jgi:hypothetical protein